MSGLDKHIVIQYKITRQDSEHGIKEEVLEITAHRIGAYNGESAWKISYNQQAKIEINFDLSHNYNGDNTSFLAKICNKAEMQKRG